MSSSGLAERFIQSLTFISLVSSSADVCSSTENRASITPLFENSTAASVNFQVITVIRRASEGAATTEKEQLSGR